MEGEGESDIDIDIQIEDVGPLSSDIDIQMSDPSAVTPPSSFLKKSNFLGLLNNTYFAMHILSNSFSVPLQLDKCQ